MFLFYSSKPGVLGSPSFPLSLWCVQWRSVREMLLGSLLITCLIHLHRLRTMMVPMLSWLQRARRCWLEVASGQNIRRILLRYLVWKMDSFLRSLSVILQHSELYSRVESTQLWYSLSLVLVLYWDDFHTLFSILKAFLALLRRFLMSLRAPPSRLTNQEIHHRNGYPVALKTTRYKYTQSLVWGFLLSSKMWKIWLQAYL